MTILHNDSGNRTLPHNLEAEKSVLGASLIESSAYLRAAEVLDARDFYRDAHRRIFGHMAAITRRSEPIDFITLTNELIKSGELDEVGGPAYVSGLTDGVPRTANVEYYAKIVKEKSQLCRVIQASNDVLVRAYDAEETAGDLASGLRASIDAIELVAAADKPALTGLVRNVNYFRRSATTIVAGAREQIGGPTPEASW